MSEARQHVLDIARGVRSRLALLAAARWAAVGGAVGGGLAVLVNIAAMAGLVPVARALSTGALLVSAGVLAGLVAWVRPRRLTDAAASVDAERGLQERFVTAVELAADPARADSLVARACYAQVEARLGNKPLVGISLFDSFRRPAAAAALMAVLAVATGWLVRDLRQGALQRLAPSQRAALAAAFADGATAVTDEQIRQAMQRAAVAIHRVDDEALAAVLAELRRQGYRPVALTGQAIRDATAQVERRAHDVGESEDRVAADTADEPDHGVGRWVRVYDPSYRAARPAEADGAARVAQADYTETWQAAALRARQGLRRGQIPVRYRRIVRGYFAEADE